MKLAQTTDLFLSTQNDWICESQLCFNYKMYHKPKNTPSREHPNQDN